MKRIAILLTAAGLSLVGAGMAQAVDTPIGTITADGNGVVADGKADNPGPLGGFVQIKSSGGACADDNGGPDDGNPDNGAESTSPTCV